MSRRRGNFLYRRAQSLFAVLYKLYKHCYAHTTKIMLDKPFRRIIRPFPKDDSPVVPELFPYQRRGASDSYLEDPDYAPDRMVVSVKLRTLVFGRSLVLVGSPLPSPPRG